MRQFSRLATGVALLSSWLIPWTSSFAQPPQARLDWVYPAGVQIGQSTEVQLGGAELDALTRLEFSNPAISATPAPNGQWKVSASSTVPAGIYLINAVGPWGVTNQIPFVIGPLGELREKEPNDSTPQEVSIPQTINGQIQAAADIDTFQFKGTKGQRIVISVNADRIDSPLDATIRLFDQRGSQIAESLDSASYDPHLEIKLPGDGIYKIQLFDAVYGGSPAHRYRLSLHGGPVIDTLLPITAQQNKASEHLIIGRGLQTTAIKGFAPLFQLPEESLRQPIVFQDDAFLTGAVGASSNASQTAGALLSKLNDKPLVSPVFVPFAQGKPQAETESNDQPRQAQAIQIPADFSGVFQSPDDTDYIQFESEKDETWVLDCSAERLGSLAQPEISIQQRNPDGSVKNLANLVEFNANPLTFVFEQATRDPRITWKAPAKGQYLLKISNLNSSAGDARFFYRIVIRKPNPNFQIIVMPASATGPTATTFFKGGRFVVMVLLNRLDGFDTPVRVRAVNLPPGITAYPVVISQGKNLANMVFEVEASASSGEFNLKLIGETAWSDEKDSVDWLPGQKPETPFTTGSNQFYGGGLIRPVVGPNNQQRGFSRFYRDFRIAVRETPVPFELNPEPLRLFAKRGTTVDLPVSAKRNHGFDAQIPLQMNNLPLQMEEVKGDIPKGQASATLKCKIGANVPLGRHTVYLNGSAPFPFAKDPAAKSKPNITWNIPSRPITLVITP